MTPRKKRVYPGDHVVTDDNEATKQMDITHLNEFLDHTKVFVLTCIQNTRIPFVSLHGFEGFLISTVLLGFHASDVGFHYYCRRH